MTLLSFERGAGDGGKYLEHHDELLRLVDLVVEHGRQDDPLIRQRLAWCHSKVEIMSLLQLRALTTALSGEPPGAQSSVLKIFISEFESRLTELAMMPGATRPVPGARTAWPGTVGGIGGTSLGSPDGGQPDYRSDPAAVSTPVCQIRTIGALAGGALLGFALAFRIGVLGFGEPASTQRRRHCSACCPRSSCSSCSHGRWRAGGSGRGAPPPKRTIPRRT